MPTACDPIDIIIPNWNGKHLLAACLDSIIAQSSREYQVSVVDNGSKDGSVIFLRQNYPDIKVIALEENCGFSAAVNTGIRASKHPLVFLLNNDTELAPDCIEKLGQTALAHPDFSWFAAKMLSHSQPKIIDGAGDSFLRGGVGYRLGTMEKDSPQYSTAGPVFGACAGAALYRRKLFDRIGYFDEDFFAYLEDVDLNFRANAAGYRCWYVPDAKVYHIGSATTGSKINSTTIRLSTRNNFFLLMKNYPFLFFLRHFLVLSLYQSCWLAFVIVKGQFPAYLRGIAEAMLSLPVMLRKRRHNIESFQISQKKLSRLVKDSELTAVQSIMRRRKDQGKGNTLLELYKKMFL